MADTSQPTVFDYAAPTYWRINFDRIPKVTWFCTNANVPGVTLGEAMYPTPMADIGITGDKLTFDTLNIQFIVDEEYQNYQELWDWITGIGFPKTHAQYEGALASSNRPTVKHSAAIQEKDPRYKTTAAEFPLYSDATMIVYNSKNKAKVDVKFKDMFPTSLSGIDFMQDATDTEYIKADATFRYLYYEFEVSK